MTYFSQTEFSVKFTTVAISSAAILHITSVRVCPFIFIHFRDLCERDCPLYFDSDYP